MSKRKQVKREMIGGMIPDTSFNWQVQIPKEDGPGFTSTTYFGFGEVRRLDILAPHGRRGMIVVQDEHLIRFFVYDKDYAHAVNEFVRYWRDVMGEEPIYHKLNYTLE